MIPLCCVLFAFLLLRIVAAILRPGTRFSGSPEEKNPFEGKRVVFIADENDDETADGVRGHLEAVGKSENTFSFYGTMIKRISDTVISFFALIVLFPLFVVIALAIVIDDPGPIFFTQKRVGKNKRFFKLHKFRTMKISAPGNVPTHMLENPALYTTRVGKFLRAHSLDELPQVWDVFIGNMSFVGPRPGLWNQDLLIAEREKEGANQLLPGMTGWAQINGRNRLTILEKAHLDGEYARKQSFLLDFKCFFSSFRFLKNDTSGTENVNPSENDKI